MKVLLTGAAGRLGRWAWQAMLDHGHDVRATDLRPAPGLPGPLEYVDLTDERACYRLLDGCEAVAHLGNIPNMVRGLSPQKVYQTNTSINMNMAQAAHELGVMNFVFASSVQVTAGRREADVDEQPSTLPYLPADGNLPARPGNVYALSKQAAEDMLRYFAEVNKAGSFVAFRFPALFTVERWQHLVQHSRREQADRAWRVRVAGEAMAYLAIEDAGTLICRAIERPRPGYWQYFPAAQQMLPGWSVGETVAALYSDVPLRKPIEQMTSLVDIAALVEAFDWQPTRTGELIRQIEQELSSQA